MKTYSKSAPVLLFGLCAILLVACSSPGPPPTSAVTKASYAVQQADQSRAGRYAKLPLHNAHKELDQAQRLIHKNDASHEDYVRARRLAEKALVDAQLAQAQTKSKQAQKRAQAAQSNIQALKKEIHRKEEGQP